MQHLIINFYECEHGGDLDKYINDLHACGASVVNCEPNYEAETAEVEISVDDKNVFFEKFFKTDACSFSQYQHYQ